MKTILLNGAIVVFWCLFGLFVFQVVLFMLENFLKSLVSFYLQKRKEFIDDMEKKLLDEEKRPFLPRLRTGSFKITQ